MELAQPCQLGRGLVCRPFTRSALNLKASKVRRQLHESYRSTAVQVTAQSTSVKVRRAAQKDFAQVGKLITEVRDGLQKLRVQQQQQLTI